MEKIKTVIKPKKLQKGDTVAFIAPASGFAALIPHRLDKAKLFFESRGYKVKIYPTATVNNGISSDTAENRAKDIMNAFSNDDVKAIITTIGGDSCHETLELLDFEKIKANPKIFCGYSDITSLHFAFNTKSDLVTFYGPAAVCEFGETLDLNQFTVEHFFKAVTSSEPIGVITASPKWTDSKDADWMEKEDLTIGRVYKPNPGFEWLKKGKATGNILGGGITSMMHTIGTEYWPDFTDKILLLETPEGEKFDKGEPIENIDKQLSRLKGRGTLDLIKGIVFGRGFGYTDEEILELKACISTYTEGYEFPVVYGVDIGHSDPMLTIPLGVTVSLDSAKNFFSIDENGVE
jgi:muramoyltetrapeptide carboxypeptidase